MCRLKQPPSLLSCLSFSLQLFFLFTKSLLRNENNLNLLLLLLFINFKICEMKTFSLEKCLIIEFSSIQKKKKGRNFFLGDSMLSKHFTKDSFHIKSRCFLRKHEIIQMTPFSCVTISSCFGYWKLKGFFFFFFAFFAFVRSLLE